MNQSVTKKPWGRSIRRFINEFVQLEEIYIVEGGYSSVHCHMRKWNEFLIQDGSLRVNFYDDEGQLSHSELLEAGVKLKVEPEKRHQFIAESEVHGYEIYYDLIGILDAEDIVRFSGNGCYVKISPTLTNEVMEYCGICNGPMTECNFITIYLNGAMRNVCRRCSNVQKGGEVDGIG